MVNKIRLQQRGRAATKRQDFVGGALNPSVRLLSSYAQEWTSLVDEMYEATLAVVMRGFPTMDARTPFDSGFDALERHLTVLFSGAAMKMAPRQIMAVDEESVRDLGMSLRDVSKFVSIRPDIFSGSHEQVIRASIGENVDLITRIPQEYLAKVKRDVEASLAPGGQGLQSLIPAMEERYKESKRWAKQVAMDQTRKAYTSINTERCTSAGIQEAEWVHTMGSNAPRVYHMTRAPAGLNGLIFRLDKPEQWPIIDKDTGERGLPGHAYFCHCTFRPIVNFGNKAA